MFLSKDKLYPLHPFGYLLSNYGLNNMRCRGIRYCSLIHDRVGGKSLTNAKDINKPCIKYVYNKLCYRVRKDKNVSLYSHLKPMNIDKKRRTKWGVIDFECYLNSNKKFEVYAIGISGYAKSIWKDYNIRKKIVDETVGLPNNMFIYRNIKPYDIDSTSWLGNFIKSFLLKPCYHRFLFYAHNGGRFDILFIVKALLKIGIKSTDIKILKRKDRWLLLRVYFYSESKKTKYYIEFRDSYALLPESLSNLGKDFKMSLLVNKKINFEHDKINDQNYMCYKEEILEYLENDIELLYYIIHKFQELVYQNYNIDVLNCLTIAQIGVKLFRSNYMKLGDDKDAIPLTRGKLTEFLAKSFFGGGVDIKKPYVQFGYLYDMNSSYTKQMTKLLPSGHISLWTKDIALKDFFGFAEVFVKPPKIPYEILPFYEESEDQIIYPCGIRKCVAFSEELKKAESLGYEITILNGYIFDKSCYLKDCVTSLYNRRLFEKEKGNSSLAYILKIIKNSLFGKFAQEPIDSTTAIIFESNQLFDLEKKYESVIYNDIYYDSSDSSDNEGAYLVTYNSKPNKNGLNKNLFKHLNSLHKNMVVSHESGIATASAISSYARIELLEMLITYKAVYFDTDSFVTDMLINTKLLSNKLGDWKNVLAPYFPNYSIPVDSSCYFLEGIFLSPKSYILKLPTHCNKEYIAHIKGINLNNVNLKELWVKMYSKLYYKKEKLLLSFKQKSFKIHKDLSIEHVEKTINTNLKYTKRIKLYDLYDRWYDTQFKYISNDSTISSSPLFTNFKYYPRKIPTVELPFPNSRYSDNFEYKMFSDLTIETKEIPLNECKQLLPKPTYFQIIIHKEQIDLDEKIISYKSLSSLIYGDYIELHNTFKKQLIEKYKSTDYYWHDLFVDKYNVIIRILKSDSNKQEST